MTLPAAALELLRKIDARAARVAVLGLGYAGLPLTDALVRAGFPVIGFDIDAEKIARLQRGESYIRHIPAATIGELLATARFLPTCDPAELATADIFILCVPTPLTPSREPDLGPVRSATATVAEHLQLGQLVVLTSTTYPGTTRQVVLPLLAERGLEVGRDCFLAYSPEREDPGNTRFRTADVPRLVGGVDDASTLIAQTLFRTALRVVVPVASAEVAEAAKILENTYRAVNIALVNELKVLYDRVGLDVWEVIDAASTKPFGFQAFYPGPGWGGHCIPIDPFYLAWLGRKYGCPARFVELAGEINTAMHQFVAAKLSEALNERGKPLRGSHICLLGMAYKKDLDDVRESPGLELLALLQQRGAQVTFNDPHVPHIRLPEEIASTTLTPAFLAAQDAVVIVTDHSAYDWEWIVAHANLVVDTRGATRGIAQQAKIVRA
jgi:UDP-N-acetyl-D-glucosamine dehydrogenase